MIEILWKVLIESVKRFFPRLSFSFELGSVVILTPSPPLTMAKEVETATGAEVKISNLILIQQFCIDLKTRSPCCFPRTFSITEVWLTGCGRNEMNVHFITSDGLRHKRINLTVKHNRNIKCSKYTQNYIPCVRYFINFTSCIP